MLYVGQTKNSLVTRLNQHRAACRLMQPEKSALAEHSVKNTHAIDWVSARVLVTKRNYQERLFLEALLTGARGQRAMNRCELFYPSFYRDLT